MKRFVRLSFLEAMVIAVASCAQESDVHLEPTSSKADAAALYENWKSEIQEREKTEFSGHVYDIIATPSFLAIQEIGDPAIPYLKLRLNDAQDRMSGYVAIAIADILGINWNEFEERDLAGIREEMIQRLNESEFVEIGED